MVSELTKTSGRDSWVFSERQYVLLREFMFPLNANRSLPEINSNFHPESHRLPILDTVCSKVPSQFCRKSRGTVVI